MASQCASPTEDSIVHPTPSDMSLAMAQRVQWYASVRRLYSIGKNGPSLVPQNRNTSGAVETHLQQWMRAVHPKNNAYACTYRLCVDVAASSEIHLV